MGDASRPLNPDDAPEPPLGGRSYRLISNRLPPEPSSEPPFSSSSLSTSMTSSTASSTGATYCSATAGGPKSRCAPMIRSFSTSSNAGKRQKTSKLFVPAHHSSSASAAFRPHPTRIQKYAPLFVCALIIMLLISFILILTVLVLAIQLSGAGPGTGGSDKKQSAPPSPNSDTSNISEESAKEVLIADSSNELQYSENNELNEASDQLSGLDKSTDKNRPSPIPKTATTTTTTEPSTTTAAAESTTTTSFPCTTPSTTTTSTTASTTTTTTTTTTDSATTAPIIGEKFCRLYCYNYSFSSAETSIDQSESEEESNIQTYTFSKVFTSLRPSSTIKTTTTATTTTTTTTTEKPIQVVQNNSKTFQTHKTTKPTFHVKYQNKQIERTLMSRIDFDVDPCQDFHSYACGVWKLKNPVPPKRLAWTIYTEMRERVNNQSVQLLKNIDPEQPGKPGYEKKLYYAFSACQHGSDSSVNNLTHFLSWMDQLGAWPMLDARWEVKAYRHSAANRQTSGDFPKQTTAGDKGGLESLLGDVKRRLGLDIFFRFSVRPYVLNFTEKLIHISGHDHRVGPFDGLRRRTKHFASIGRLTHAMETYKDFVRSVVTLFAEKELKQKNLGQSRMIENDIEAIVQLEMELVRLVSSADVVIQKWTLRQLYGNDALKSFDWKKYFQLSVPEKVYKENLINLDDPKIAMYSPDYLTRVLTLIGRTPYRTVQNFIIWRIIRHSLPFLSLDYHRLETEFLDRLGERQDIVPRDKWCIIWIKGKLEQTYKLDLALGRLYKDVFFTAESRELAAEIAEDVLAAFKRRIDGSSVLDKKTKYKALVKARNLKVYIGYPDWISDDRQMERLYRTLRIGVGDQSLAVAHAKIRQWSHVENMNELLTGHNQGLLHFGGPPTETGAWYIAELNSVTIPMGLIQKPIFSPDYGHAVNFGALGAVIGHEITHGFDQKGSRWDYRGHTSDWWSNSVRSGYRQKAKCLARQYEKLCVSHDSETSTLRNASSASPSPHKCATYGAKTATENFADYFGTKIAFDAYLRFDKDLKASILLPRGGGGNGDQQNLGYFSHEQLFFLNFASFFCGGSSSSSKKKENQAGAAHQSFLPSRVEEWAEWGSMRF